MYIYWIFMKGTQEKGLTTQIGSETNCTLGLVFIPKAG